MRKRHILIGIVITFSLWLLVGQVVAQAGIFKKKSTMPDRQSETKLSCLLEKLVSSYETGGWKEANRFASSHDLSVRKGLVKVILVINADPLKELPEPLISDFRTKIETIGGKIEGHAFNYISAWLPIVSLPEAKDWPQVKCIREPTQPRINDLNSNLNKFKNAFAQGSIVSEGVSIIEADIWQEKGYTGRGVKVGIIDSGFKGYEGLLGQELPSKEKVFTKAFGTQTDFLYTEHGTACAEIAHDIATEADLYLVNITNLEVDFANAVSWLEGRGVKIVNCSVDLHPMASLFNEELKKQIKEGVIDPFVDEGVVWVQCAGNEAQIGWIGRFYDSDDNKFHEWVKGIDELNCLSIHESTKEVLVVLSWDDPEGASNNDYDLYVFKIDEEVSYPEDVIASSENRQGGDDDPIEDCLFTPQSGKSYGIAIRKYAGVSKELQLIVFTTKGPVSCILQHYYPRSSIIFSSLADDPNVITVGAVPWDDPYNIEPYSSQGPTLEGLIKPDLVSPDCVSTFSYEKFCGTSAATPHVAGACALVLQAYSDYSPYEVKDFLAERALDLGDFGKDNVYGSGLIQLKEPPSCLPNSDIKVNGSGGPITLNQSDTLAVTVALDNNGLTDNADWWLAADTPFGIYFYTFDGWTTDWVPAYQGPLFYLDSFEAVNTTVSGLPIGAYTLYFGVDTVMDGNVTWGSESYDTVVVNVTE